MPNIIKIITVNKCGRLKFLGTVMPNSVYRCIFGNKIFSKILRFSALSRKLVSCHTSHGLFTKIFFVKGISEHFHTKYFTVKISRCMVHLSTLILPGSGMTCFGRVSTLSFTVDESGYIKKK